MLPCVDHRVVIEFVFNLLIEFAFEAVVEILAETTVGYGVNLVLPEPPLPPRSSDELVSFHLR